MSDSMTFFATGCEVDVSADLPDSLRDDVSHNDVALSVRLALFGRGAKWDAVDSLAAQIIAEARRRRMSRVVNLP